MVEIGDWITKNYAELVKITDKVCNDPHDAPDLLHCVLEQVLKNIKMRDMNDKERFYFFVRMLKNNYHSKTSPYYYQHKKVTTKETTKDIETFEDIPDTEYEEELPDMEWVYSQLEHLNWFDRDLFVMWLELGSLTAVSKKTTIPLNSVGRYINITKQNLIKLWQNRN